MRSRRLLTVLAALALPLTAAAAPATATPQEPADPPFLVSVDRTDDLTDLGGAKVNDEQGRGLDVLTVRHRVRNDGRLVIVSKHRDLTRANTHLNPDTLPVGGALTVLAAYIDPTPNDMDDSAYALSFGRGRHLTITQTLKPGVAVTCRDADRRSRIDLERDVVRYVVPVSCLGDVKATRSIAQVIRYKVTGRSADGIEEIELVALDQNNKPTPRLALR